MNLRYGILSTSSIAPRFIAAVRASGAGEIVALSSRTLEKAREKAALWEIPKAYGSHEELLADGNVNIVYISSVNAQHYPLAKAAILAGKNIVCEKPCTTSVAHTRELFALAREKGVFLMEAEKMLFLPAVLEVKKRIASGELGEIHMVELSHSFSAGYNAWLFDPSAGGGTLLSSGIYAVQLLCWLFGPIRSIGGVRSVTDGGGEWQYALSGETESGVLFHIKNSTRVKLENKATFYGTNGTIDLPEYWKARKIIVSINGQEPIIAEFPCEHELSYEAAHIADCVGKGLLTSPVVTEELSVAGIAALEAVKAQW